MIFSNKRNPLVFSLLVGVLASKFNGIASNTMSTVETDTAENSRDNDALYDWADQNDFITFAVERSWDDFGGFEVKGIKSSRDIKAGEVRRREERSDALGMKELVFGISCVTAGGYSFELVVSLLLRHSEMKEFGSIFNFAPSLHSSLSTL